MSHHSGKRPYGLLLLVLFLVLLVPCDGRTATDSPGLKKAREEGRVVLYTSFSQADLARLTDPFFKKYPGIEVEIVRGGSSTLHPKITNEYRARKAGADLIFTKADYLDLLQKQGLLQKYQSPEDKAPSSGYAAGAYVSVHSIAYNTRTVSMDHVPRRYADLLDTRWKNKIAINLNNFMWGYAMLDLLGQEKGMDFLTRLKGLNARAQRGSSLTAQMLAAGEFQVSVSLNAHDVSRMKRQGAPIDWARINDPLYADLQSIGILVNSRHPNAAQLFVDYVLSVEGQRAISEMGRTALREDVPQLDDIDLKKVRIIGPEGRAESDRFQTLMVELFTK